MENLREAAYSIYEEYISEKASPRLKLDDSIVKRLLFKIRTEPPDPEWFNEVQTAVFDKIQNEERFLESFKRSMGYVKLLAELDLLKDTASSTKSEEEEDEASIYDTLSLNSLEGSRGSLDEITRNECEEEEGKGGDRLAVIDADTTLTPENSGDNGLTVKRHRR